MGTDMQGAASSREHTDTMAGYLGCTFPTLPNVLVQEAQPSLHLEPGSLLHPVGPSPCCRTPAPWDHEVVAAAASGQFHLDAAVCLEEKHFLQGLVLTGTASFLPFFSPRNSDFTIKDSLLKSFHCTHIRDKIVSSYIQPLAEVCLHSSHFHPLNDFLGVVLPKANTAFGFDIKTSTPKNPIIN